MKRENKKIIETGLVKNADFFSGKAVEISFNFNP
jgi:hypothetical protein